MPDGDRADYNPGVRISWLLAAGLLRRRGTVLLRTSAAAAVSAVALGIASLVVVLALMTGYSEALRDGILAGSGHVVALFPSPPSPALRGAMVEKLTRIDGVVAVGDALYLPGLLTGAAARSEVVQLKAADVPAPFARLAATDHGAVGIAVGAELARKLAVAVGDRAWLQVFAGAGGLQATAVRIDEVFQTGFAELDERWVLATLPALRGRLPGVAATALEVFVADPENAEEYRSAVDLACSGTALVTTWQESNRNLFAALRWQKLSLALVLSLVVGVGAFEVASALVVLVTEKRREIGVLLALGGEPALIRKVVVLAGWAMGAVGVGVGLVLGLLIVRFMGALGLPHFSPEIASIYMVDHIPFRVRGSDLSLVVLIGLAEVLLAAFVQAVRVARKDPAEVLRWV